MAESARRTTGLDKAEQEDAPVSPEVSDLPAFRDEHDIEAAVRRVVEGRREIDGILRAIRERLAFGRPEWAASDNLRGTARVRPGSKTLLLIALVAAGLLLSSGVASRLRMRRRAAARRENRPSRFPAFPDSV